MTVTPYFFKRCAGVAATVIAVVSLAIPAHADTPTIAVPTTAPVVATEPVPTAPPPTAAPVATAVPTQAPVSVDQDSSPVVEVTQAPPVATAAPTSVPQVEQGPPAVSPSPGIPAAPPTAVSPSGNTSSTTTQPGGHSSGESPNGANQDATGQPGGTSTATPSSAPPVSSAPPGGAPTATGITLPPDTSGENGEPTQPSTSSLVQVTNPSDYQAPAQLSCHGAPQPNSGPFLISPYAGWADINSFVDHDDPDYSVDGTIILANGLTASAGDGIASDYFPAYWSPVLRQYVNYDGHNGYDIGISYQPVLAAAAGTVEFAGWNSSSEYAGYGQMVLIDHHNGYVTLYGHLSKLEVQTGDQVQAGQEIGISGSTGNSSGPHLHFSVFHNCHVTDPYGWTGKGKDPLSYFNGEASTYLWLPGHDPLVLNPPPNWPTFPLGLKIPLSPTVRAAIRTKRFVPPANRLLLLQLPAPIHGAALSPAVAAARTETATTQEAETMRPYLDDLERQGLVESHLYIPAAAAVWVRGTASAAQLESLPGVASLSGVQPQDVIAAQAGLAHGVLLQVGAAHAPSLWPAGFHSALQAWRPIVALGNGQAAIAGFALPGSKIEAILHRGGSVAAVSQTRADPQTGGFVALLHDTNGNTPTTRPGDVLEFHSGNRTLQIPVPSLQLRVRPRSINAVAQPFSTVSLAIMDQNGRVIEQRVLTAKSNGVIHIKPPAFLEAGSQVIGSMVDTAGNQIFTSAFVPGMLVQEAGSVVRGWTVGHHPRLTVTRNGRTLINLPVHPASNGAFQVDLQQEGAHNLVLQPGDVLTLGSARHHHLLHLPALSVRAPIGGHAVTVHAPPGLPLRVILYRPNGSAWSRTGSIGKDGILSVQWPSGALAVGSSAVARFTTARGDTVFMTQHIQSIVLRAGSAVISGQVSPGVALTVRVVGGGAARAGAIARSDPLTGQFSTLLQDLAGKPIEIRSGMRLRIWNGDVVQTITVPIMRFEQAIAPRVVVSELPPHASILLSGTDVHFRRVTYRTIVTGPTATLEVSSHLKFLDPGNLEVAVSQAGGITIVKHIHSLPANTEATPMRSQERGIW